MNELSTRNADFQFMIEQAVKAPSGHNTQPWLFEITDVGVVISPDFTRALPVVDPSHRELFVSLGCATENLCIAAAYKGYLPQVNIGAEGVISVTLSEGATETSVSRLFSQIGVRQTNRRVYNGARIPEETITRLAGLTFEEGVKVHFFQNGTPFYERLSALVYEGNRLQMGDDAFKHELQQWMRYNKQHQDATRDGLSYAVFGAPNVPRFIAKAIMGAALNAEKQNKSDQKKLASSSHLVLLTTATNTPVAWVNLGRTLERLLLESTAVGIAHAYFNQPNEIASLAKKMVTQLGLGEESPTVLLRLGYGKPMPYSVRRC